MALGRCPLDSHDAKKPQYSRTPSNSLGSFYQAKKGATDLFAISNTVNFRNRIVQKSPESYFQKKKNLKAVKKKTFSVRQKASDPTRVQHLDGFKPTHLEHMLVDLDIFGSFFVKFGSISPKFLGWKIQTCLKTTTYTLRFKIDGTKYQKVG